MYKFIFMERCSWANQSDLEKKYHDTEWGVPVFEDQKLFEFIILEGAQAGLSWSTILKKREGYRKAFDNFDIQKIATYDQNKIESLQSNTDIIRNKLKIKATVTNAIAALMLIEEFESIHNYLWEFINNKSIINNWKNVNDVPATTPISDELSKDLKKRGFKFVGSTICYALMQAIGMVNDHTTNCFRHKECKELIQNT